MQASSDQIMEISQAEAPAETPAPASTPEPVAVAPEATPEPIVEPASTEEVDAGVEPGQDTETAPEPAPALEIPFLEFADGTKIPENAVIKRKIDGEMREVTLKDALEKYSLTVAGDKRFAEANKIKQKSEHQLRQLGQKEWSLKRVASRFVDSMAKGEMRDAVDVLCEFTGQNSEAVWGQVAAAQKEAAQNLASMTPEEWELQDSRQEAEYWKRRESVYKEGSVDEDIVARKFAAQEKYGLEDKELQEATQLLLDLQKQGVYNDEYGNKKTIKLDDVVSTALDYKIYKSIDETCREVLPAKAGDQKLYSELFNDTKEHNISKDDWISILGEIKKEKEAVASKLAKKVAANQSPTLGKQTATKSGSESKDYLDIVDLDDL